MSDAAPLTPDELSTLKHFISAYGAILELLDTAVTTSDPPGPVGWGGYDDQVAVLRRHGPDEAALLQRHGGETPEAARRIVCDVIDSCDLARDHFQSHPYAHQAQGRAHVRGIVWDKAWPLRQFLAKVGQEARPGPPAPPTVDDEDEKILRALKKAYPRRLTQDQIEARSHPRVSRRTVSDRMPCLLRDGLVAYPNGPNKGVTITEAGLSLLGQLDAAKPAQ
jgi:hypothetical protein